MLHFKPNWFARILRNSEPEVHVTVVETPPVAAPPPPASAEEVLDAAHRIISLQERTDEPPAYIHALNGRIDSIDARLDALQTSMGDLMAQLADVKTVATVAAVEASENNQAEETATAVAGALETIAIPATATPAPPEVPAKRKRSFI